MPPKGKKGSSKGKKDKPEQSKKKDPQPKKLKLSSRARPPASSKDDDEGLNDEDLRVVALQRRSSSSRWLKLIEAPLQDLPPLSKMLLQTFHPKPKNKTSPPQLHLHPLPVTMQVRLKGRLHKQVLVSNHIGPDYPLPPMVTLWTFVDCNCIVLALYCVGICYVKKT